MQGLRQTLAALIDFASADPRMETGCLFYKMRAGKHRLGPETRTRVEEIDAAAQAAYAAFLQAARDAGEWPDGLSVDAGAKYLGEQIALAIKQRASGEDKARIRELMGEDALMIEDGNPRALIKIVRDQGVDVLIAGGRNMYTALKARIPFLDINQEREFGYAGYDGMLELVRQLALTLEAPVWQKVRAPAPWAAQKVVGEPLVA